MNRKFYKIFLTKIQILAIAELVNEDLARNILKQMEQIKNEKSDYYKIYYLVNKERIRKQQKKYQMANYDKILEYNKKYNKEHEEEKKEERKKYNKEYYKKKQRYNIKTSKNKIHNAIKTHNTKKRKGERKWKVMC